MLLSFISTIINTIINLIFIAVIIYLIIRNNQLANKKCSPANCKPKNDTLTTSLASNLNKSTKPDLDSNVISRPLNSPGFKQSSSHLDNESSSFNPNPSHLKSPKLEDTLKLIKDSNLLNGESKSSKKGFVYNHELCMECVRENQNKNPLEIRNCPHCGSENYDTGCIPAIIKKGQRNNCISKKNFTREQAFRACVGVSNANRSCNLIDLKNDKDKVLSYMVDECGNDSYYCVYDESDSCSYHLCKLDDYYSYGNQSSYCNCEPSKDARERMGPGWGRECIRGNSCKEFYPLRKAPELWTDTNLNRFFTAKNGAPTYMNVPNIESSLAEMIYDAQII